jgi:hypothetical protein
LSHCCGEMLRPLRWGTVERLGWSGQGWDVIKP